jgi:predicted GH43/DUF377 family glycosyl hydrolase
MMFRWRKLGRIFNPTEIKNRDWMREYAQAPSVIVFEDFVRVYFSTRQFPDANGQYISRLAYIDLRKDNLFEIVNICKEPIMSLGGIGTFDEFGTYPASAIKTEDSVRIYYAGWTRCVSIPYNVAIGMAFSYDNGETFHRFRVTPLLPYTDYDPFVISGPKIRRFNDKWYLFYIAGKKWVKSDTGPEPIYKIRMAYSDDGIHWTRLNRDIISNSLEEDECQAGPDVFYHDEKYHMFFSCRYALDFRNNKEKGYRIGYASSIDLIHWVRDDSNSDLTFSETGWDSTMLHYPHVFRCDDKIYMLYNGNEFGRYGLGLAVLEE